MRRHRIVRVPASSANLGPGFDVLAGVVGDVERSGPSGASSA
jgi:homoserine kinase